MGYNAGNKDGDAVVLKSYCIPLYRNDVEQEE